MTLESDTRERQRKALETLFNDLGRVVINDRFLDLVIDTVEGA
jgi:hypothetical protein